MVFLLSADEKALYSAADTIVDPQDFIGLSLVVTVITTAITIALGLLYVQ